MPHQRAAFGTGSGRYSIGPAAGRRYADRARPTRHDVHPSYDWPTWKEVRIRIEGLPPGASTHALYKLLSPWGNITSITLSEFQSGLRTGQATVAISPPPKTPLWDAIGWTCNGVQFSMRLEAPAISASITTAQKQLDLDASFFTFGVMLGPEKMMEMQSFGVDERSPMRVVVNPEYKELSLSFHVSAQALKEEQSSASLSANHYGSYKISVKFRQISKISEISQVGDRKIIVIALESPPLVFRRTDDILATHDPGRHWNVRKAWYRQTNVYDDRSSLKEEPLQVRTRGAIIDLGSWTTYRLVFDSASRKEHSYESFRSILRAYNVPFVKPQAFQLVKRESHGPTVTDLLSRDVKTSSLSDLLDGTPYFSYKLLYQLEACMSQGFLAEQTITRKFLQKLSDLSEKDALERLEYLISGKKRIQDPMEIFSFDMWHYSRLTKIPKYCVEMRIITVTPTKIYCSSPTVETSNRIVREYSEVSDRFIRVKFTDEKIEGRLFSSLDSSNNAIFTRIYRCLKNGIIVGNMHFDFLAMGNSQFREHGAFFFASIPGQITVDDIRARMGDFSHIKTVAKYASRLGQCFSTTRAIKSFRAKIVEIPDVERNGYTFTDGVGKISKFAAWNIAADLGLSNPSDDPPSVFQFRLGGCKGVLAIDTDVSGCEVHVRKSQYKFPAKHDDLEIIRCASFSTATLNRQLIVVLRSIGVPEKIFMGNIKTMLSDLNRAMSDQVLALSLLQKQVDFNHTSLTVARLILDGFMEARDPFTMSILHLWRSWNFKLLKEKAALVVEKGAMLLGCVDETSTLKGYFYAKGPASRAGTPAGKSSLPEIFVQVSMPHDKNQYRIIEGVCIVARNPSLHPGDIRVVRAVNVPALHHLKNAVVFAQTGDRDVPNMCSGGDLDGDDFVVIWDPDYIPKEWDYAAMEFPSKKQEEVQNVTIDDVIKFYVHYIKHDILGTIANTHLAGADYFEFGIKDPRCFALAEQHSVAVDFVKSGVPAALDPNLRPKKKPHYMNKHNKPKHMFYTSTSTIGKLYDVVELVDFDPFVEQNFDKRVLEAYQLEEDLVDTASTLKLQYDNAVRQIMMQYEIETEFEVWSAFVLHHSDLIKAYDVHQKLGELFGALKSHFQELCYTAAGGRGFDQLGPFIAAMYTATSRDIKVAEAPLISFPWLFHIELGRIANGRLTKTDQHCGVAEGNSSNKALIDIIYVDIDDRPGLQEKKDHGWPKLEYNASPLPSTKENSRESQITLKSTSKLAAEPLSSGTEALSHQDRGKSGDPGLANSSGSVKEHSEACLSEDSEELAGEEDVELEQDSSMFDRLTKLFED